MRGHATVEKRHRFANLQAHAGRGRAKPEADRRSARGFPSLVSRRIGKRRGERQEAIPIKRPPAQPSVADFDDPRPEEQRVLPLMPCALVFRGRCVEYRLDKRGGVVLHPLAQEPIPLCQLKAEVEGVPAYWQEHRKANLAP